MCYCHIELLLCAPEVASITTTTTTATTAAAAVDFIAPNSSESSCLPVAQCSDPIVVHGSPSTSSLRTEENFVVAKLNVQQSQKGMHY